MKILRLKSMAPEIKNAAHELTDRVMARTGKVEDK